MGTQTALARSSSVELFLDPVHDVALAVDDAAEARDSDPTHYLGSTDALIDELVARARRAGGRP